MSRKISEYFKVNPKVQKVTKTSQTQEKSNKILENNGLNIAKVRDCNVAVKDIGKQFGGKLKLFEEISLKDNRNSDKQDSQKAKVIENGCKICKFCGIISSSESYMIVHMKTKHPDKLPVLNCSICDARFLRQNYLEAHLKNKHQDGQIDQFECDFDGKIFKSKQKLLGHMKIHRLLIECKFCQKAIKVGSIKGHIKNIHETKNLSCKACSKIFKSAEYLKRHEAIHNKKYQCEICKKMYPSIKLLNRHKTVIHVNPKSFECNICGMKFNFKQCFMKHQRIHDKNRQKSFKCQRCDYVADR